MRRHRERPLSANSGHCKLSRTITLSGRREAPIHSSDWFGGSFIRALIIPKYAIKDGTR